ncbi:iron chelate uptake ABC transporter family permease subunit [Amycolatopsis sp. NBC_00355]|uniref:iron chelate uptake ABC transporter family permease subunit n=1 Tax=Amycolatopsis sp. NBC_00355 TaxID=2975957 RepID=UPI002E271743
MSLADRLIGDITAKRTEITRPAPADPARKLRTVFLYLRGQAGVYYLFGRGSGADSPITALGAADVASEAGVEGMRPVSPDALIKARPDVILVMTKGLESVGGPEGLLQVPGVAQTPAGLHHGSATWPAAGSSGFGPQTPGVLDVSGALMQGRFGNPPAEPAIVGVSTGATAGASLSIVAGWAFLGAFTTPAPAGWRPRWAATPFQARAAGPRWSH